MAAGYAIRATHRQKKERSCFLKDYRPVLLLAGRPGYRVGRIGAIRRGAGCAARLL